ncbi:TlpA family protein disulfide reductase [Streptomyces sp. NBC_00859]|uniref:TlpA family protein disulfide reductase n=1 Tax=Streptomyces sp. NBC_00859 TaxID=2903682 RepID=UPI00386D7DE4|nr:TlpA family protein disulfide reductase [Streptomyces sp. NBC_00859]
MVPEHPARRSAGFRRCAQVGVAVAACALALSACESGPGVSGAQRSHTGPDADGIVMDSGNSRADAPQLSGKTLEGATLDVGSAYKGKIVVVNVWASWCPPCRDEARGLEKVSKELAPKGVEFAGVNTRDASTGSAKAFQTTYGITYPSLYDPAGKLILRFPAGSLSPQAIPSTVVIDRKGRIAARKLSGVNEDTLHEMIDPLIAEK